MAPIHRIANIVRDQLLDAQRRAAHRIRAACPSALMAECMDIARKLDKCRARGFKHAAVRLATRLRTRQHQLRMDLDTAAAASPAAIAAESQGGTGMPLWALRKSWMCTRPWPDTTRSQLT